MVRLGLIADIHARAENIEDVVAELEWVVDRFDEGFRPDYVFVLGDIVEDGGSAETDCEHLRTVKTVLDSGSFPTVYLLGNHDVVNLSRETLREELGMETFYGSITVDGTTIVYLDSSAPQLSGARGELGPNQRSELQPLFGKLERPLVFVHHPIGTFDLADNVWFSEYPERAYLGDRKELFDLIEDAGGIRGSVTGHIHESQCTTFGGYPHGAINAFNKEYPDAPVTGTYAELTVGDTVSIEICERDETVASFQFD